MVVAPSLSRSLFTCLMPCSTGLAPVKSIDTDFFASAKPERARSRQREMPDVKRVILGSPFLVVRRMHEGCDGFSCCHPYCLPSRRSPPGMTRNQVASSWDSNRQGGEGPG